MSSIRYYKCFLEAPYNMWVKNYSSTKDYALFFEGDLEPILELTNKEQSACFLMKDQFVQVCIILGVEPVAVRLQDPEGRTTRITVKS
jgi:hypothetical protein